VQSGIHGARAGQMMTVNVVGGNIKTGPAIPLTFPNGSTDTVFETSCRRPATTRSRCMPMSDGPFGKFAMTLMIK